MQQPTEKPLNSHPMMESLKNFDSVAMSRYTTVGHNFCNPHAWTPAELYVNL